MLVNVKHQKRRDDRAQPGGLVKPLQARRLAVMHQPRIIDALHGVKFRGRRLLPSLGHAQTLSAHRNFALRERGFAEISLSLGWITCLVSTLSEPARSPCWNACLTWRSSPEWYVSTTHLP